MLGWMRAQSGDLTLTRFRTQKTALLLARLALFPQRTHPREGLADLLWPDAGRDAGRNNLKQSLAILRRLLEPPGTAAGSVLIADRLGARLNPAAFSTDVADFEAALKAAARSPECRRDALARALDLYRGELLPGVYDDWVVEERERLTAVWDEALEEGQKKFGDAASPPAPVPPPSVTPLLAASLTMPHLPVLFTRFFGREPEQADLAALLGDESVRLVTLTGPGGVGKTRLAIEVARQAAEGLNGRACFVPLADLTDPRLIPEAIADALGLPRTSAGEPLERVAAALCAAPALLVLDNLEQLGEGAAPPLLALLTRVPSLTILATSRSRVFIAGEREYPLSPLPTPQTEEEGAAPPERLLAFPGVQLFADRAREARSDFQITPRNAGAVAALCCELEGIPLALELAAAWSSLLTPAQMRDRIGERFTLLRSRRKGVAARHQTLQGAIGWSYDLLPPDLARFWARLSVFRGGFSAEAAQEVCEESDALDSLGRLRARSLVTAEESGGGMRFRLLETLREFGTAQMGEDERDSLAALHAAHFLHLAEQAEPLLTGPEQARWLDRLGEEQDNLRAALDRLLGHERETALTLAGRLWPFWELRGYIAEGRRRLAQSLAGEAARTVWRARVLHGAGVLADAQDDRLEALGHMEESVTLFREIGERRGLACPLAFLGYLYRASDPDRARALLEESLALCRAEGNQPGLVYALCCLGRLALEGDHSAEARASFEESLEIARSLGYQQGVAESLHLLGGTALRQDDYAAAQPLLEQCLVLYREIGNQKGIAYSLRCLGEIAFVLEQDGRVRPLLEECLALLRLIGNARNLLGLLQRLETVAKRQEDAAATHAFGAEVRALRELYGPDDPAPLKSAMLPGE